MGSNFRFLFVTLLVLIIAAVATGCGNGEQANTNDSNTIGDIQQGNTYPVTVVDSIGRSVTLESEPQKIISLSPAITEILFAIGVGDKIAGVTDYCDYPAKALKKPRVGSFKEPNMEVIISSQPEVVFVSAGIQEQFAKQFNDLGIKVIALDANNFEQVLDNIKLAGRVAGAGPKSLEVARDMGERMDAVKETVAQSKTSPSVFFEVWDDPLMTAGPGSFIDDLITKAGGTNIAGDANKEFAEFSLEALIDRNPDIYILNDHAHTPEDIKKRSGYEGSKAIRNNNVYSIEDDLVTLPGPRIIEGLEQMARIIHPEAFQDLHGM